MTICENLCEGNLETHQPVRGTNIFSIHKFVHRGITSTIWYCIGILHEHLMHESLSIEKRLILINLKQFKVVW